MKKLIVLVCFLGLFAAPLTAIAGEKARVEFNAPTKIIQVYTFFDAKLGNLCYVTEDSIFCIPFQNLPGQAQQRLENIIKNTPKDMSRNIPDIIKIR